MKHGITVFLIAYALVLGAVPLHAQQEKTPYVILVSFDGFRSDYVEKYNLPNFKSFIKEGAQAEALIPSFPSLTFPNHYTLVTGLYPGHHGLVDNNFYDSARKTVYGMRWKGEVAEPGYYGGKPLWTLAKENGLKTASFFWVGSEVSDPLRRPDYFYQYADSITFETRINQVFTWLKLPEKERPHFITLYFSIPDHESHSFGPWSPETQHMIVKADSLLGTLMKGLKEISLPINTILVSDHGMSEVKVENDSYIFLDELMDINRSAIRAVASGAQAHIYCQTQKQTDSLYLLLKQKEKNFTVYRRQDFPERWHYQHPRVGNLLILASPNHYIRRNGRANLMKNVKPGAMRGEHGYDPVIVHDMYGIFYAKGPNIKPGTKVPAFQNVDVFPLIASILNLKLPSIDGNTATLKKIYRK